MTESTSPDSILYDFCDEREAEQWAAVNDGVMGGVSQGSASITKDSCLMFSGTISLENNGGFASIRALPRDYYLSGYKGIRIRVKGDGRIYQFRLRDDRNFDGIAYKHEFQSTRDTWVDIDLSFGSFLPTYRGRTLDDVKPVVPADIKQIGFLIADKTEGPFELLVDWIQAYK